MMFYIAFTLIKKIETPIRFEEFSKITPAMPPATNL